MHATCTRKRFWPVPIWPTVRDGKHFRGQTNAHIWRRRWLIRMRKHVMSAVRVGFQRRCGYQRRWQSGPPRKLNGGNEGMNAAVFKSVFQPVGPGHPAALRKRPMYLHRWDWHLRNFLISLMPPAAIYLFVCWVEWFMSDEVKAYRDQVLEKKAEVIRKEERIEARALTLAERLEAVEISLRRLEGEKAELKKSQIVDAAKAVLAGTRYSDKSGGRCTG